MIGQHKSLPSVAEVHLKTAVHVRLINFYHKYFKNRLHTFLDFKLIQTLWFAPFRTNYNVKILILGSE